MGSQQAKVVGGTPAWAVSCSQGKVGSAGRVDCFHTNSLQGGDTKAEASWEGPGHGSAVPHSAWEEGTYISHGKNNLKLLSWSGLLQVDKEV